MDLGKISKLVFGEKLEPVFFPVISRIFRKKDESITARSEYLLCNE